MRANHQTIRFSKKRDSIHLELHLAVAFILLRQFRQRRMNNVISLNYLKLGLDCIHVQRLFCKMSVFLRQCVRKTALEWNNFGCLVTYPPHHRLFWRLSASSARPLAQARHWQLLSTYSAKSVQLWPGNREDPATQSLSTTSAVSAYVCYDCGEYAFTRQWPDNGCVWWPTL